MANYSQDGRPFRLETPLGKDVLLLVHWRGEERVSQLYEFTVEAWSTEADIDVKKLLLQSVSLKIALPGGGERTIGGIVRRFVNAGETPSGLTAYHLDIVPPHWVLTIGRTYEIFQDMDVPEILEEVFTGLDIKKELNEQYNKRQYCFQYRETKWDFASRLMEQEGIWYKFDHAASPPALVMASANSTSRAEWGLSDVLVSSTANVDERVLSCHVEHSPYVGKTVSRTYSEFLTQKHLREETVAMGGAGRFKPPAALVDYVFDQQMASHRQGVTSGGSEQASDLQKLFPENARNAKLRQQSEETRALRLFAHSTHRGVTAGGKVNMTRHSSAALNTSWMVLSVRHAGDNGGYLADDSVAASYSNDWEAMPHEVPYRPMRNTPWPRVAGTHVGVVVGPDGEEIYPDKFGRVHVAFRFDDNNEADLKHSCWVRMAQMFAGPSFGSVFLPRIGHEVLVDFLDGNPDNPMIVGQLYGDHNMPPWALPDNKTQSGVRTHSTPKGATDAYNELRFEDKKDAEQIYVQAQKDLETLVKNDEKRTVQHDRTTIIEQHDTRTLNTGDDTHTITEGNQVNTVSKGDQTNEVTKGKQTVTIGGDQTSEVKGKQTTTVTGNRTIEVKDGNESTTVKVGNITIKASAGKISIEAAQSIELKVGPSSLKLDPSGVQMKGAMIKIEGSGMAELKAPMTTVKGDGMLTLKGGVTMIN